MNKQSLIAAVLALSCMASQAAPQEPQETRVLTLPRCPVSQAATKEMAPALLALLKIVAPVVVEKAIDLAANAATAAGQDSTVKTAVSSYQGNFYRWNGENLVLNSSLGCIVYVRGTFGDKAVEPADGWKTSGYGTVARRLGMAGHPSFYMELTLEVSADRTLFRLMPEYVDFATPLETSWWRPKERAASVSMSFFVPGTKEPFASTAIAFPSLPPGVVLRKPYLDGYSSNWMVLPAPTETTTKLISEDVELRRQIKANADELAPRAPKRPQGARDAALSRAQEDYCATLKAEKQDDTGVCPRNIVTQRAAIAELQSDLQADDGTWSAQLTRNKLDAAQLARKKREQDARDKGQPWVLDSLQPFNLDITMAETAAGSEFLKFMGSVLAASKKDVADAVKTRLQADPAADKTKAEDELDQAYIAAIDAKAAVERKLVEITNAADDAERAKVSVDLPPLKLKANIAYRKAGLAEPYPGVTP